MRHNKSPLHKQLSFLDRLARFVRHPTTDWAATQIDPAQQRDALRAKQHKRERARMERAAAMIRNEEFDVLRRHMRNRKLQSPASLEGLTLPPTQPPARHVASQLHTLHKIAAIERQIQNEQKRQPVSRASDMVQHSGLAQIGFAASALRPGSLRRATLPRWNFTQPQPNTDLPGAHHSVLPTPAVIELAAFDFAELRDAQVESQLLTALQTEMHPPTAQLIFQSLLDFYWASRQNDKLQSRALDYVQRFGCTPKPRPEDDGASEATVRTASFLCAELFDALQLRAFERFVAESCNHLVLDWGELVEIALPQRAPLTQALRALNDRPVELEMHGAERLLAATRLQSSALDATDAALRLQVLRLVGDEAGFTDLAVELAVASGSSPAEWEPPRFHRLDPARSGLTTLDPGATTHMQTGDAEPTNLQTTARLGGDLRGDDGRFARSLRAQSLRADAILVELDAVRRMDFAAATALLNWFDAQVQLGKTVELRGAHSLLVPFLRSVGLPVAD